MKIIAVIALKFINFIFIGVSLNRSTELATLNHYLFGVFLLENYLLAGFLLIRVMSANVENVKMNIDKKEELLLSAQINFENLAIVRPDIRLHPIFVIAKHQLDEAISGEEKELTIPEYD